MSINVDGNEKLPISESEFRDGKPSRLTIGELTLESTCLWRQETPRGYFESLILVRFIRTYDLGRKTANYVGFDFGQEKSTNPEGTLIKQFDADSIGLAIPPFGIHYLTSNDTAGWDEALSELATAPDSTE